MLHALNERRRERLFSPVRVMGDVFSVLCDAIARLVFARLVREQTPGRQYKFLLSPGVAELHAWPEHAFLQRPHNLLIGKGSAFELYFPAA